MKSVISVRVSPETRQGLDTLGAVLGIGPSGLAADLLERCVKDLMVAQSEVTSAFETIRTVGKRLA